MDKNAAAVKIQAVFQGFCVRKPRPLNKLRVITKTKAEAAEIRRRMDDEYVVELIRRDEKERLKMTEWIMSLLLRLDEIQGAIPFVRESRKAVIRDLISSQKTVDDMIVAKCREDAATEVPKVHIIQPDGKPETSDLMDWEEAGDEMPVKMKSVEGIDIVREENEKLRRIVYDLLKKSEKQSEMIHVLGLRISQLEEQAFQCNKKRMEEQAFQRNKKRKVGNGKKKSSTSTEESDAQTNNSDAGASWAGVCYGMRE